jgi:hypothetical protein
MVILITLVQEKWFGGVSYHKSSRPVLFVAGLLTFVSAVMGGLVAAWISGNYFLVPGIVMSLAIVTETTFLIRKGKVDGPLWFDISAAGSLIVGILLGVYLPNVL